MSLAAARALWTSVDASAWRAALEDYPAVVAAQDVPTLVELDRWYRDELTDLLRHRQPPAITRAELLDVVRWKMRRGEWRQRNLVLVERNAEPAVRAASESAFRARDTRAAVDHLATLAGVGPATASAVLAAHRPAQFPFFDDLVGLVIPELGAIRFSAPQYVRYAEALRGRAAALGSGWTAQAVGLALWSAAGGKRGQSTRS